jgi:hypothetical protein
MAVKVWDAKGATRGATSAADPQIVAGGSIVGLVADKEPQTEGSDRCVVRSHKVATLLTMSNSCMRGFCDTRDDDCRYRTLGPGSDCANSPHDAHKCRSADSAVLEG